MTRHTENMNCSEKWRDPFLSDRFRSLFHGFGCRQNGGMWADTGLFSNARKVRETYCFSKDWRFREAVTYFTMYTYNFCRAVRTLREPLEGESWRQRTPAMVAGLTDHVWSISEWISFPSIQRR